MGVGSASTLGMLGEIHRDVYAEEKRKALTFVLFRKYVRSIAQISWPCLTRRPILGRNVTSFPVEGLPPSPEHSPNSIILNPLT
jgi:hypothetical protein